MLAPLSGGRGAGRALPGFIEGLGGAARTLGAAGDKLDDLGFSPPGCERRGGGGRDIDGAGGGEAAGDDSTNSAASPTSETGDGVGDGVSAPSTGGASAASGADGGASAAVGADGGASAAAGLEGRTEAGWPPGRGGLGLFWLFESSAIAVLASASAKAAQR